MSAPRTKFPHLYGCMENLSPTTAGKGMCFHRSASLVLDLKGAEVVMGTFRAANEQERPTIPDASTEPFIHCWVEYKGAVLAPSLIERMGNTLAPMSRESYYEINGAKDLYRLTRQQLLVAAAGAGLSAYLKHGTPLRGGRSLGSIMLDAAGIPYEVTKDGTVIPSRAAEVPKQGYKA